MKTNRKSYTRFRLVPKSTTLHDLEGPLCKFGLNVIFWLYFGIFTQRYRPNGPTTVEVRQSGRLRPSSVTIRSQFVTYSTARASAQCE